MPAPWILPASSNVYNLKCYLIVLAEDKKPLLKHKQASLESIKSVMGTWLTLEKETLQVIYKASQKNPKKVAPANADQLKALLLQEFLAGRLFAFESTQVVQLPEVVVTASAPAWASSDGSWTDSDREDDTQCWRDACQYNLMNNNFCRYTRIIERRDFYRWFYKHTAKLGFQTRWALAASIVATGAYEVAIMWPATENFGRMFETLNNELQAMMREGNQVIFDNVFPKLRQLLMGGPLKNPAAIEWDMRTLSEEQALIQPLYKGVSAKTREHLERIARQKGIPGLIAYFSPSASVDEEPPYIRGGPIPPFTGTALTSIDERWHYGMTLGDLFTPGGTGFNPAIHKRPAHGPRYTSGAELALVRTRPNLHLLDAALDLGGVGTEWLTQQVEDILGKLTTAEKAELLQDRRPDGGRYSIACRSARRKTMFGLLAKWRLSLEAQMNFLSSYIGGEYNGPWRDMEYSTLAPIIHPFGQAEKNKLHTPYWQRIFGLVCDDDTIVDAANDLGLREPLRSKWIDEERELF